MKKQFLILFAFISVLALSQVPQRFNKVIVTGDITSPQFIKTGSTADSVLLGNGSARAISAIKTDTVSLSNRINAKATGSGTANGTNTGDETLTSIKTKLGAATSVSDGYLKYQDWSIFNSKEPAISKKTAFNKNFGTTTGTVLEGRTFGTAANSAVGDFQPIENQRLSTTNSPSFAGLTTGGLIGTSSTFNSTIPISFKNGTSLRWEFDREGVETGGAAGSNFGLYRFGDSGEYLAKSFGINRATGAWDIFGAATFSSTVNSTGFLLNGNNLTSGLTTNYIPKWNGSSFVNATAGTDYQLPITLTTIGTSGAATFSGNVLNVPNYGNIGFSYGSYTPILTNVSGVSGFNTISARYTTIGGITTVSIKFVVVASSTSCTFNISLPRSATSSALFLTGNANSSPSSVINGSYLDANNAQVTETFPVATNFINTIVITYE